MKTRVKVVAGNRGRFVLRWTAEGAVRQRTLELDSRPSNRKEAYRLAAELERELAGDAAPFLMLPQRRRGELVNDLRDKPDLFNNGEWETYRLHFEKTHLATLSDNYAKTMLPVLNRYKEFARPKYVHDVTASRIRAWLASMKDTHSPSTARTYLRHLSAFLSIAVTDGIIDSVPKVRAPKVTKTMKGKPISSDELEKIKSAVETNRPEPEWKQWKWNLDGLWLSGLRISEAYRITWEPSDFWIDMEAKHPEYVILGDQKNKQHQRLPIVPDFVAKLREVSEADRVGNVFKFPGQTKTKSVSFSQVKNIIRNLCKDADVSATSHDFRRSFGSRWALKVMPQILQKLMRHSEIKTTMSYYVHLDTEQILEAIISEGR